MKVPVAVGLPDTFVRRVGHESFAPTKAAASIERFEEVELPGPGAYIPYIRIHLTDGHYQDIPKHMTELVEYAEEEE